MRVGGGAVGDRGDGTVGPAVQIDYNIPSLEVVSLAFGKKRGREFTREFFLAVLVQ